MIKHRLLFGVLMSLLFTALILLDGWLDGSLVGRPQGPARVQGTLLCVLLCLVEIPAHLELAALAGHRGIRVPVFSAMGASMLVASASYWQQFLATSEQLPMAVLACGLLAVVAQNYLKNGLEGMLINCGGGALALLYLGVLAGFVMTIRIQFGLWPLLMTIFVIKSSDIGAYTVGRFIGRHKFAPRISPGKTWEGLVGAIVFAVIVALVFADRCEVMAWQPAILFGAGFAVIGQMGDLVESLMKRDAQLKDSSSRVPGYGGVLDVVDSPLVAAPFAYCFLRLTAL